MTDTEKEVLPCPFCGETPEITKTIHQTYNMVHRCDVVGVIKIERITRESITDKWNGRQHGPESSSAVAGGYPACAEVIGDDPFMMVEDYLDAGYYDEAVRELRVIASNIENQYPRRDESKHAV